MICFLHTNKTINIAINEKKSVIKCVDTTSIKISFQFEIVTFKKLFKNEY